MSRRLEQLPSTTASAPAVVKMANLNDSLSSAEQPSYGIIVQGTVHRIPAVTHAQYTDRLLEAPKFDLSSYIANYKGIMSQDLPPATD